MHSFHRLTTRHPPHHDAMPYWMALGRKWSGWRWRRWQAIGWPPCGKQNAKEAPTKNLFFSGDFGQRSTLSSSCWLLVCCLDPRNKKENQQSDPGSRTVEFGIARTVLFKTKGQGWCPKTRNVTIVVYQSHSNKPKSNPSAAVLL